MIYKFAPSDDDDDLDGNRGSGLLPRYRLDGKLLGLCLISISLLHAAAAFYQYLTMRKSDFS